MSNRIYSGTRCLKLVDVIIQRRTNALTQLKTEFKQSWGFQICDWGKFETLENVFPAAVEKLSMINALVWLKSVDPYYESSVKLRQRPQMVLSQAAIL